MKNKKIFFLSFTIILIVIIIFLVKIIFKRDNKNEITMQNITTVNTMENSIVENNKIMSNNNVDMERTEKVEEELNKIIRTKNIVYTE